MRKKNKCHVKLKDWKHKTKELRRKISKRHVKLKDWKRRKKIAAEMDERKRGKKISDRHVKLKDWKSKKRKLRPKNKLPTQTERLEG